MTERASRGQSRVPSARDFWRRRGKFGKASFIVLAVVVALVFIGALIPSEGDDTGIPDDSSLTLSRDGQKAAFASDRASPGDGYAIYVARLGTKPRRVTHSARHHAWPALSPDGSRIVFARSKYDSRNPQRLFVVNADGSGLRLLTKGDDWAPTWSPDGETIAFTRGEPPVVFGFGNVYAVDVDGTNQRILVRDAQDPAWSPDGSKIAFVRGLGEAIAVLDLNSKRITRVVRSKRFSASNPAWSPDGTRIVFVDMPRGARSDSLYGADDFLEIYVVNVDGSGLRRLTRNTDLESSPTWTPDGRITFERYVGTKPSRFFVMNADGTGVRRFVIQRENEGE